MATARSAAFGVFATDQVAFDQKLPVEYFELLNIEVEEAPGGLHAGDTFMQDAFDTFTVLIAGER